MKRMIIEFLIGLPIVVLGYILLDFLYETFIVHNTFAVDPKGISISVIVWLAVVLVSYFIRRKKDN
jgi:hypothetical protein